MNARQAKKLLPVKEQTGEGQYLPDIQKTQKCCFNCEYSKYRVGICLCKKKEVARKPTDSCSDFAFRI